MSLKNSNVIKSPRLQGTIVENILLLLLHKEHSIYELLFEMQIQRKMPWSDKLLKKYLVYLIDYELVSYSGQTQLFFIEDGGLDLLNKINMEKNKAMADTEDITITLEKDIGNDFLL